MTLALASVNRFMFVFLAPEAEGGRGVESLGSGMPLPAMRYRLTSFAGKVQMANAPRISMPAIM